MKIYAVDHAVGAAFVVRCQRDRAAVIAYGISASGHAGSVVDENLDDGSIGEDLYLEILVCLGGNGSDLRRVLFERRIGRRA